MLAQLFLSGWLGLGFEVSFGTLIPLTSEEEFKTEQEPCRLPSRQVEFDETDRLSLCAQ